MGDQRNWYNIDPSFKSSSPANTWAIYASGHQYYSDADRKSFDKAYNEDFVEMAKVIGKNDESRPGIEANGDTEYGMALAKGVPTTFWYVDGGVYEWAKQMADTDKLPLVFSVSYAMDNADELPKDEVQEHAHHRERWLVHLPSLLLPRLLDRCCRPDHPQRGVQRCRLGEQDLLRACLLVLRQGRLCQGPPCLSSSLSIP